MSPNTLQLILSPRFIECAHQCYDWAKQAEKELESIPEKHRNSVIDMHRHISYRDRALRLINHVFKNEIVEFGVDKIRWSDLRRSHAIQTRQRPDDIIGLIYHWFHSHVNLYVPGLAVDPHYCFTEAKSVNDVRYCLFHSFLDWAERQDCLESLNPDGVTMSYVDEISGMFFATMDYLTEGSVYFNRIYENVVTEDSVSNQTFKPAESTGALNIEQHDMQQ